MLLYGPSLQFREYDYLHKLKCVFAIVVVNFPDEAGPIWFVGCACVRNGVIVVSAVHHLCVGRQICIIKRTNWIRLPFNSDLTKDAFEWLSLDTCWSQENMMILYE